MNDEGRPNVSGEHPPAADVNCSVPTNTVNNRAGTAGEPVGGVRSRFDGKSRFLRSSILPSELIETFCPICGDQRRRHLFNELEFPIWQCRGCTHKYVSPTPTDAVLAEYYAKGFMPHTDDENVYEGIRGDCFDAVARAVVRTLPRRGLLLEVGPGFGGFLVRAEKDGWQLSGTEISESAAAVCRRRLGLRARILQTSFEQADLAPESLDCIVMINVIEHVREPLKTCQRALRLLRRGGCLALRWPQYAFNKRIWAPLHLHSFTGRSMERLLHNTGFIDVREHWAGIQDYSQEGFKKHAITTLLRVASRIVLACTFSRRNVPVMTRLTLALKP